jgi:hypothetical protein
MMLLSLKAQSKPMEVKFGRMIWQLKIPNAGKMFLWKACHNLLPNKDNLRKRGIMNYSLCPICGLEVESTHHILWSCPLAIDVAHRGGGEIKLKKKKHVP